MTKDGLPKHDTSKKWRQRRQADPDKIRKYPVPHEGDVLLINETKRYAFNRDKGGRYYYDHPRRYFGIVREVHPHILLIETSSGNLTELINDFVVGILQYKKLAKMPEKPETFTYEELDIVRFADTFEELLLTFDVTM